MNAKSLLVGIAAILLISNLDSPVLGKPMLSPTPEEAAERSPWIVIADYIGYSLDSEISYFRGPIANYKVIEILRGSPLDDIISVIYSFTDGSACIVPKDWKFSEGLMPKKNSRWILFLVYTGQKRKGYGTYRGDYGRWPASKENIQKVVSLIENPLSCARMRELKDKELQGLNYDCETDYDCMVGPGKACGDCISKTVSLEARESILELDRRGWEKDCWASPAEIRCAPVGCACINNKCTIKD